MKKVINMEYTLERYEKNFNKYIIKYSDGSEKYLFFKGGKKALKEYVTSYGIDDCLQHYEIEKLEGRKTNLKKAKKAEFNKQIEELQTKKTDIVLQLMNMTLIKGSPEHKSLREQLHNVQEELLSIPGFETWTQQMSHFSSEELRELRKLGEEKKADRKEKKIAKIKGQK
jgi:hypothetical protein